jgi:hypothetical protein
MKESLCRKRTLFFRKDNRITTIFWSEESFCQRSKASYERKGGGHLMKEEEQKTVPEAHEGSKGKD